MKSVTAFRCFVECRVIPFVVDVVVVEILLFPRYCIVERDKRILCLSGTTYLASAAPLLVFFGSEALHTLRFPSGSIILACS